MFNINGITFEITELDGEFFYKAQQGQLHSQTLKKVIRDLGIDRDQIRVYDAKNGVFSVVGEEEAFWAKMRRTSDISERIDLLFA